MTNPNAQDANGHGAQDATTHLGAWVAGLANSVELGLVKAVAPYGLTPIEFNLLRFCLDAEGETTATRLARLLPIDPSRISRVVTGLVDRGLLRRRRLRDDRRVVMLRLSAEGRDLIVRACGSMDIFVTRLMEGISQRDVRVFRSVVFRIIANQSALEGNEEG